MRQVDNQDASGGLTKEDGHGIHEFRLASTVHNVHDPLSEMVSRSSLGMLISDMNSSSTSEDWSRDSIVTSEGAPGDRPAVDVAAVLVGIEVLIGGGVAVDGWWVEGSGWTDVDWTEVEVAGV